MNLAALRPRRARRNLGSAWTGSTGSISEQPLAATKEATDAAEEAFDDGYDAACGR